MKLTRRGFVTAAAAAGAFPFVGARPALGQSAAVTDEALEQIAAKPILDLKDLKAPVILESIELLRKASYRRITFVFHSRQHTRRFFTEPG